MFRKKEYQSIRKQLLVWCRRMLEGFLWLPVGIGALCFLLYLMGIRTLVVRSGSMEPGIPTGGIVLVDTWERTPEPGAVITYRQGAELITHRVVRCLENGCQTGGDANETPDSYLVREEQIVGTVCMTFPYLGYWIAFWQSPKGILMFGSFLLLETVVGFLIRKYVNKEGKECGRSISQKEKRI
jgi:signal peptidase